MYRRRGGQAGQEKWTGCREAFSGERPVKEWILIWAIDLLGALDDKRGSLWVPYPMLVRMLDLLPRESLLAGKLYYVLLSKCHGSLGEVERRHLLQRISSLGAFAGLPHMHGIWKLLSPTSPDIPI